MLDKAAAPQFDTGPAGTVLNVYRNRPGIDEPATAFAPRSLAEHEHPTLQVSVLLRETIATVGWQTGGGRSAGRRVRGGQAYVVPFEQPHDFRLYRPQGMVNFHIGREALVALCPEQFERDPRVLDELAVVDDPMVAGLAAGVHAAALVPNGLSPLYIDTAWTMLALHLAYLARSPIEVAAAIEGRLPARRLARVLDYIDAHFTDADMHVAGLAAVAGLSPVHFTRMFTRAVGASPMQYIIGRRLERARELLARDNASIAVIALETGFGSHSRFTEAFRRRFGTTPTAFRYGGRRLLA